MTVQSRIPLARPEIGEREHELVAQVLDSGQLSLGPMLDRFERDFAAYLDVDDAVAVSSGTAALQLAVRASGWQAGDRVVTSPFSFVASANCLLYEQVEPVFCDIDPVTLNIDPDAVRAACDERTVGILPVDVFGYPANLPALLEIAQRKNLTMVEDACEALGAVDAEGIAVGAREHLASFAFYANKQLATGEGGMLTGGTPEQRELLRSARNQGRAPDMDRVDHVRLGFNFRLSDVAAALGVAQLERIEERLARRAAIATSYKQRLADVEGLELPCDDRGLERRSWFLFFVLLPTDSDRESVVGQLAAQGIASKAYMPSIHTLTFYRERFGYAGGEFPVAEAASQRCLALPFYPAMDEGQIERVCEALRSALGGR